MSDPIVYLTNLLEGLKGNAKFQKQADLYARLLDLNAKQNEEIAELTQKNESLKRTNQLIIDSTHATASKISEQNEEIARLKKKISDLLECVEALSQPVATTDPSVDELKQTIQNMEDKRTKQQAYINSLKAEIEKMKTHVVKAEDVIPKPESRSSSPASTFWGAAPSAVLNPSSQQQIGTVDKLEEKKPSALEQLKKLFSEKNAAFVPENLCPYATPEKGFHPVGGSGLFVRFSPEKILRSLRDSELSDTNVTKQIKLIRADGIDQKDFNCLVSVYTKLWKKYLTGRSVEGFSITFLGEKKHFDVVRV